MPPCSPRTFLSEPATTKRARPSWFQDGRWRWIALAAGLAGAGWPDLDDPRRTGAHAEADAAVVIGQQHYARLPEVPYAARDAEALWQWLIFTRGVPAHRVERLIDAPTPVIGTMLSEAFARVGDGGTVWITWAGHGAASAKDGLHLLLGRDDEPGDDAVSIEAIQALASRSKAAHVVLIVDAAFAGVGRDGQPLDGTARWLGPDPLDAADPRVITWTASRGREVAGPIEAVEHGAFTWHVLGALSGFADGAFGAPDGVVTLEEAQAWVRRRLYALDRKQTSSEDPRPGPRAWVIGPVVREPPTWEGLDALPPPPIDPQLAPLLETADEAEKKKADDLRYAEEELRRQMQERADLAWSQAYGLAASGSPDGLEALRRFVDRYDAVTYLWNDLEIVVSASQIPDARRLLAHGGRPTAALVESVRIEPATFPLGTPAGPSGRRGDETVHLVTLTRPFAIATTEVSRGLWATVTGTGRGEGDPAEPVTSVSWLEAATFCNALSALDGYTPAYAFRAGRVQWDRGADGWRLPTEAEWVLAAGHEPTTAKMCEFANVRDASLGDDVGGLPRFDCDDAHPGLAPVRDLRADPRGLHAMFGNAAEWTWDAWSQFDGTAATDPAIDQGSRNRVVKGGSFRTGPGDIGLQRRGAVSETEQRDDVGLRVVRTIVR